MKLVKLAVIFPVQAINPVILLQANQMGFGMSSTSPQFPLKSLNPTNFAGNKASVVQYISSLIRLLDAKYVTCHHVGHVCEEPIKNIKDSDNT